MNGKKTATIIGGILVFTITAVGGYFIYDKFFVKQNGSLGDSASEALRV